MSKPSIRARVRIPLGETPPGISFGVAGEPNSPVINPTPEIRLWISGRWGDDEGSQGKTATGSAMVASIRGVSGECRVAAYA